MRALEVSVDGTVVRLCIPPEGGVFNAMLGNGGSSIRAFVSASNREQYLGWLVAEAGQMISFRLVEIESDAQGSPPDETRARDQTAEKWLRMMAERANFNALIPK